MKGHGFACAIITIVMFSSIIEISTIGMANEGYDGSRSMADGPMLYSSYIGGGSTERSAGIVVDGLNRTILVGQTWSLGFPTTQDAYQRRPGGGGWDVFVCILNTDGSELIASTYLGGRGAEYAEDVAVDSSGSIYVLGRTWSTDFPTSESAFQRDPGGSGDAFISKLSWNLSILENSTYLGGEDVDHGIGIEIDGSGNVIVTGTTKSPDFPVTPNAVNYSTPGTQNVFVSKLDNQLSRLVSSSIIGGSGDDEVSAVALDSTNNIVISGRTPSTDLPITDGVAQATFSGGTSDAYVLSLSSTGDLLIFSTYLGGSAEDHPSEIVIDPDGAIWIVGDTSSIDFPTTNGAIQETFQKGQSDAFVTKMDRNGSSIVHSTFLGGKKGDIGIGIDIDEHGDLFVSGHTSSEDFPTLTGSFQEVYGGGFLDVFIVKLDPSISTLKFSSFLGGKRHEYNVGLDISINGEAHIAGHSNSTDYPTVGAVYQSRYGGGEFDLFISKLPADLVRPTADAGTDIIVDQHEIVTFDGTGSVDDRGITSWKWTFMYSDVEVSLTGSVTEFRYDYVGQYDILLNVSDGSGNWAIDNITVTVRDITPPMADAGLDQIVDQHETVVFDGRTSTDNVGVINWMWSIDNNGSELELYGETSSFTFDRAGEWTVLLTVWDLAGLTGFDIMNLTVRDIKPPIADAGEDVEVGYKTEFQFDGTGSFDNVGIVHYSWTFEYLGHKMYLVGESPAFIFDTLGEFLVELNVTDFMGNSDVDELSVSVVDIVPPVADAGSDLDVAQHTKVDLDGSQSIDDIMIINWTWSLEDEGKMVEMYGPSPTYTFENAGEYLVSLIVFDVGGNRGEDTILVRVRDTTPPFAIAGSDIHVDQNKEVILDGTRSTDNVGLITWTWIIGINEDDVELNGSIVRWSIGVVGSYQVMLKVRDAAGNEMNDTLSIFVEDITPPVAKAGPDSNIILGEILILNGSRSEDNVDVTKWTWRFEVDGVPVELSGNQVEYTFQRKGAFLVELIAEDEAGNTASDSMMVTVKRDDETDENRWNIAIIVLSVIALVILLLFIKGRVRPDYRDGSSE